MRLRRLFLLVVACLLLAHGLPLASSAQDGPVTETDASDYDSTYTVTKGETKGIYLPDFGWDESTTFINVANTDDDGIDAWQDGYYIWFKAQPGAESGKWYQLSVRYALYSAAAPGDPDWGEYLFGIMFVDQPIVVEDQSFSGPAGQPIVGQLVASGGGGPPTFLPVSPPTNASVTLDYDGALKIVPNEGETQGSFRLYVTDGFQSVGFTVTWQVIVTEVPPLPGGPTYGTVSPGNGGGGSSGTSGGIDAREGSSSSDNESTAPSDDDPDQDTGRGSETCGRCN